MATEADMMMMGVVPGGGGSMMHPRGPTGGHGDSVARSGGGSGGGGGTGAGAGGDSGGSGGGGERKTKAESGKDKARGSYRCGKCGAPKKGHICPYQPKLKRRPDEPPPEMKNASTQVEMDEFLVLRRLNLEIQGFPESYVSGDPDELADLCGAEPHPLPPMAVGMPPHHGPPPGGGLPSQHPDSTHRAMAVGPDEPMSAGLADDAAGTSVASGTDSK